MNKTLLFFLGMILSTFCGTAQPTSYIDTIEVVTTQIPLKIRETGRNITVLKGKDIQQMSFTSLDDLFQYIPGIEVQMRNAFGAQGDISMRGATFTQVLILMDGMKLNDPLTGHFNSYLPVSPAEIERIEVLRGAAAAMYGADAVGGVINIITKGFSRQEGSNLSGSINYGQHGLIAAQQGFSMKKDKLYVGGGFSMNQSDGELISEKVLDNTTLDEYHNYFDIKTTGLTVGYDMNEDWSIRLRTAYDYRDFNARYFYTTSTFDKSTETTRNWWNQLQILKIGQQSSTDINVAYKYNTDEFIFSPDFPSTNNHISQYFNFQVNHLQQIDEQISLKFGIQADRRSIESNDRGTHQDWHTGIYAMGVYRPTHQLNLTASLRLDYDENYRTEFSPQLNISYLLPKVTLRASAGRSIRAADYTERYVSNNLQDLTPNRSLGNPDLMAENSWSEEIGFDYNLTRNWLLKGTAFFRQSTNLIDYVNTNENDIPSNVGSLIDSASYFFAKNITDIRTAGVEIESWLNYSINNTNIQWSLGYTYLNTSNEEEVVSVYISSHAGHLLTSNAIIKAGKFNMGLNGLYKIRDERAATAINTTLSESYTVWNLRLGYQIVENFGLNVNIHNLFDAEYQNILGAPMPSRWLMGGLRFDF